MQQIIEIDAEINARGEIHAKLSGSYRPGPVHLVVFLDSVQTPPAERNPDAQRLASFSETPDPGDFAGIWSDFADQDFQDFLDDLSDRRREAFAGRCNR